MRDIVDRLSKYEESIKQRFRKEIFMKHGLKRFTRYVLVAALSVSLAVPTMAATKAEVQSQIEDLKNQQSELESQLAELKQNKSDTESFCKYYRIFSKIFCNDCKCRTSYGSTVIQ